MDFGGKRVLVTGGSRGIGAAVAGVFAERGASVCVAFGGDAEAARGVVERLAGSGHAAIHADLGDRDGAERLVAGSVQALGGLDVVVNNAAVRGHHPIATTSLARWTSDWDAILQVNLKAPADICFHAARWWMTRGRGGAIVNVSSRGVWRGEPDMPAYGASKAGLNALTRSLALALGPHNITVNAVAPGFVQTDGTAARLAGEDGDAIRAQSPLGRVATAAEVAEAVIFLAGSPMATGTIMDLNGGSYLR